MESVLFDDGAVDNHVDLDEVGIHELNVSSATLRTTRARCPEFAKTEGADVGGPYPIG
jgi:hypothetical protein